MAQAPCWTFCAQAAQYLASGQAARAGESVIWKGCACTAEIVPNWPHCIHHPHAVASTATITRESLYHRFLEALQRERPEVLATLERQQAQRREQAERDSRLGQLFRSASAATSHHRRQQQQEQQQQQQQEQQQQQGCDSPSHRLPPHPGGDHQLEPQAPSSGFAFGFQL